MFIGFLGIQTESASVAGFSEDRRNLVIDHGKTSNRVKTLGNKSRVRAPLWLPRHPHVLIKSVGVLNQVLCGRPKVSRRLKRTVSLRPDRKWLLRSFLLLIAKKF